MTTPNLPFYPIENLYLFPAYTTRAAYKQATGQDAPAWNPSRPEKYWFDPKAAESPRRSVVYDQALVLEAKSSIPAAGPDDNPLVDVLVLSKEEAASVNLPPEGPDSSNFPGAGNSMVPAPLRPLGANEQLFFPFPGVVAVKNLAAFPSLATGFTGLDRQLLQAIAKKLGV